jgi:hypothetical protein
VNHALVCRWIDVNVYRKSTGRLTTTRQSAEFRGKSIFSADHHQQYLAKSPNGYFGMAYDS